MSPPSGTSWGEAAFPGEGEVDPRLNLGVHMILHPASALQKPPSLLLPCTEGVSGLAAEFTSQGQGGPFQAASKGHQCVVTCLPVCGLGSWS